MMSTSQLQPGEIVANRYRVVGLVGSGGYGQVYLAQQLSIGREIALKVLRAELVRDERVIKRFQREAKQTSRLCHPHTVIVFDSGQDEERGLLYLAMEYIEGETLKQRLVREQRLDGMTTLALVEQIADSLQHAHDHDFVHRDLKPGNIILTHREGRADYVKVIDFGIAKAFGADKPDDGSLTVSGTILGTPHYMAPEVASDDPLDGRTDTYALGVITFQLLTGQLPFRAESHLALLQRHLFDPVPSLFDVEPRLAVPSSVDHVVRRAMAKCPEQRPQRIADFARQLRRCFESDELSTLSSAGPPARLPLRVEPVALSAHGSPTMAAGLPLVCSSAHGAHPHASSAGLSVDRAHPVHSVIRPQLAKRLLWPVAALLAIAMLTGLLLTRLGPRPDVRAEAPPTADSSLAPQAVEEPRAAALRALHSTSRPIWPRMSTGGAPPQLTAANAEPSLGASEGHPSSRPSQSSVAAAHSVPAGEPRAEAGAEPDAATTPPADQAARPIPVAAAPQPDAGEGPGDASEPTPDTPRATSNSRVSCSISVRPWGEVWYKGAALPQRAHLAELEAERGRHLDVEIRQAGVIVARENLEIPKQGECRLSVRVR